MKSFYLYSAEEKQKALDFGKKPFGMAAFLSGAFTMAIPGILLQLVLIPVLVAALEKAG